MCYCFGAKKTFVTIKTSRKYCASLKPDVLILASNFPVAIGSVLLSHSGFLAGRWSVKFDGVLARQLKPTHQRVYPVSDEVMFPS